MKLWAMIWLIGLTWIIIEIRPKIVETSICEYNYHKRIRIKVQCYIFACIFIEGGMMIGALLGGLVKPSLLAYILIGACPAIMTYLVGYSILKLYEYTSKILQFLYVIVFIISIVFWTVVTSKSYIMLENIGRQITMTL